MDWYYLSFASDRFLGGVYIRGETMQNAYFQATLKKLNPGGEVIIVQCPPEFQPHPELVERILTKEEVLSNAPQ